MPIPLLQTKLHIPRLPSHLTARPHLVDRLDAGLQSGHRLTLVSAPAGFGKTTLLCEWIHRQDAGIAPPTDTSPRFAWLFLDESDNDPTRFWSYVVGALQTVRPGIGETMLAALDSPEPASVPSPARDGAGEIKELLAGLINELLTTGSEPLVLVLDDLHVVHERQIHDALAFLAEHLPPLPGGLHLVLSSRADPPWPLARLRARRQMTELRTEDLRFMPDEAAAFLRQTLQIDLSEEDVSALDARTEGWIAGLQLAALALQNRAVTGAHDRSAFVRDFGGSHRFVLDYLVEEVLGQQPDDVRTFLLHTSILERMTAPLCDALLQDTREIDSRTMLAHLEQCNLFIVPLDGERRWYRYHHLFADLLRSRLDETGAGARARLHLLASQWYEGAGLYEEAIEHALSGAHHERAADLILDHFGVVSHRGAVLTLHRWLAALPETIVRADPMLCYSYSMTWTYHSLERAQDWADAAQEALASRTTENAANVPLTNGTLASIHLDLLSLQASIAFVRGDDRQAVLEATQQALALLPPGQAPPYSLIRRLADVYKDLGRDEDAEQAYVRAGELAIDQGNVSSALQSVCGRVLIARRYGRLPQGVALCRRTLRMLAEPIERLGKGLPTAGLVQILLGRILLEWNELEEAEETLMQGLDRSALLRGHVLWAMGAVALARTRVARGCAARPQLDDLLEQPWSAYLEYVAALRAWIVLLHRRHTTASAEYDAEWREVIRWATDSPLQLVTMDRDIRAQFLKIRLLVEAYRTHGRPRLEPVLAYLDEQYAAVRAKGWTELMIDASIQQAMVRQALGDREQALASLARALELAEPGGWVRCFADEGAPMAKLLSAVLRSTVQRSAISRQRSAVGSQQQGRTVDPAYVARILAACEQGAHKGDASDAVGLAVSLTDFAHTGTERPSPTPHLQEVDALSARELEVLRLLTTHLSSTEIARELYVSKNTVRSHIGHIYDKLGAHSRAEAVTRAKELGLI